jgi:hypothetical protein
MSSVQMSSIHIARCRRRLVNESEPMGKGYTIVLTSAGDKGSYHLSESCVVEIN